MIRATEKIRADKKRYWEMKPQELADLIDPNLEACEKLRSYDVMLVKHNNRTCVLKSAFDPWPEHFTSHHIQNERKALEYLEGIRGIPKLYIYYEGENHIALLKEYIPGIEINGRNYRDTPQLQKNMQRLVEEVEERNVFFPLWDMDNRNIILNNDQPYFFDLGLVEIYPKKEHASEKFRAQRIYFKSRFFPDI